MPVPASSTRAVSPSRTASTHEVLPPYFVVARLGVAIDPRQPHALFAGADGAVKENFLQRLTMQPQGVGARTLQLAAKITF